MDARFIAVTIEADRPRELRIDFNVLADAERVLGANFLTNMALPMSLHGMRAICWASWRRDEPGLTIERVGDILQDCWPRVYEALVQAWLDAQPVATEGDAAGDPTQAAAAAAPS